MHKNYANSPNSSDKIREIDNYDPDSQMVI
jgi:hypothetical protein